MPYVAVDAATTSGAAARVTMTTSPWPLGLCIIAAPRGCPEGRERDTATAYSRPSRKVATLSLKTARQLAARGRPVPRCEAWASS
jgi:hypothetical protein